MNLKYYIAIARPDHWLKNLFVLPGIAFAAMLNQVVFNDIILKSIFGIISICLVSSANYVINEWFDADYDRFHPVKNNRLSITGKLKAKWVSIEYILLLAAGLIISYKMSLYIFMANLLLLIMGILYNVKPFRAKDIVFIDVLTESINNAIRLVLGWFIVSTYPLPPVSLVLGYWMGGAYIMAVKRFAEFRFIGNDKIAGLYRRSFRLYSEKSLLISAFFYALIAIFFIGVFLVKYRVELILSVPFFAILFSWYLYIGMKNNSASQNPEHLFKEYKFIIYCLFMAILVLVLLIIDIPEFNLLINNAFFVQERP